MKYLVSILFVICMASTTFARGAGGGNGSQHVTRDAHGRIKRSAIAKHNFEHTHPCPSTGRIRGSCPGYVIDHIVPLKRGGQDAPSNMQWQTIAAAKAKDKWE